MSTAPGYPSSAKLPEAFATHAVARSGASPSRIAGSTIESATANNNFGKLISARRLPAIARNDLCNVLEASSSTSPWRGSTSGLSMAGFSDAVSR